MEKIGCREGKFSAHESRRLFVSGIPKSRLTRVRFSTETTRGTGDIEETKLDDIPSRFERQQHQTDVGS